MVLGTLGIALIVWPDSGILGEGGMSWFLLALVTPVMLGSDTGECRIVR